MPHMVNVSENLSRGNSRIHKRLETLHTDNRGITGLETAIILIAFVVVSAVLAYTLLSAGIFASQKSESAIHSGLEETRATAHLVGDVIAKDNDADNFVDQVVFTIANALGGAIDLTETVDADSDGLLSDETTKNHSMVVSYVDEYLHISDLAWTKTQLGNGDNDNLLEQEEKMLITVELAGTRRVIGANCAFQIEVLTPSGAVMVIDRVTPAVIDSVMRLGSGGTVSTDTTVWIYRKKITIDHTKVVANLTNFPLLINLASDSDLANHAQDDGDDIYFTSSDETTHLNHEIEKFDGATGELVAWVNIPSLSASADTELYMYYGNASASSQQDVTNVWDSSYQGVWHLDETGTGTRYDSTSDDNDGTPQNYDGDEATSSGQINGADDFHISVVDISGGATPFR